MTIPATLRLAHHDNLRTKSGYSQTRRVYINHKTGAVAMFESMLEKIKPHINFCKNDHLFPGYGVTAIKLREIS